MSTEFTVAVGAAFFKCSWRVSPTGGRFVHVCWEARWILRVQIIQHIRMILLVLIRTNRKSRMRRHLCHYCHNTILPIIIHPTIIIPRTTLWTHDTQLCPLHMRCTTIQILLHGCIRTINSIVQPHTFSGHAAIAHE